MKATSIVMRIDDLGRVVIPQGDSPRYTYQEGDNIDTV